MIPSAKRQRTEESSFTSVISKLTAQSASMHTSAMAGAIIPAQKNKKAIIQPYRQCILRVSVHEFFYTDAYKEKRDLFLQAMAAMINNTKTDDPWSYYAIAGIHGLPHEPYDSAESPQDGYGYCEHGTVLFPVWHRPYVLLFEQAIRREAANIAKNLDGSTADKRKCYDIALSLSVPYLDWESSFTAYQGVPDVFTEFTIDVKYPNKETKTIPNPLRSYVLPVNLSKPISASDVFNPTAKPNYHIPDTLPFTPASYPTVRQPDAAYQSPTDTLNLSIQRACNLVFRPQIFAVMLQTDWAKFSNHYSDPVNGTIIDKPGFYGHYASIEVVHDSFHDAVGGNGGHMSYPDIAAFDPIFWFHHCNVDRLLSMWQYANPRSYVPDPSATDPSQKNNTTPLTPFWNYKSNDNEDDQYLTALDVQLIADWNYTYPIIDKANSYGWTPEQMKYYLIAKFRPDNHYGIRWYLNISKLPKRLDIGPYQVRVFIDLPNANIHTPLSSPNYAGSVFVFARSRDSNCKNCESVPFVSGTVELTTTMKRLGISVDTEPNIIKDPISKKNPPGDPFAGDLHKFTLVYVTAAGKEEFTFVYVTEAGGEKLTLDNATVAGRESKLNEELLDDSTGKHRTKPILSLSWMAVFDDKFITRGDMKPEQMNELLKSVYRTSQIPKLSYDGGIIKTNISS